MIIGQQEAKVDFKNRCFLPKKYRSELGSELIITQGFESCLVLVSRDNFQRIAQETASLPFTVKAARHTNRYLLGNADKIELDAQGRFLIPEYLKKFAEINEAVVFVGVGTFLEMWSKTRWIDYQEFLSKEGSEIADKLTNPNRKLE